MRRLIVFASVAGAPGVTTTALAVATSWPEEADGGLRPVVVEADPSGGDLMIRFGLPAAPSLLDVAAEVDKPHAGSLLGAARELPCGVRMVVAVPGRGPCTAAVRLLAGEGGRGVLLGDERDRGTVLLDAGRVTDDVEPLLPIADQVVLVARGGAESLTQVSAYGTEAPQVTGASMLAVVGPSPYSTGEITKTLGFDQVVLLPWDPKGVAGMSRPGTNRPGAGGWRPGKARTASLAAAARELARRLARPQPRGTRTEDPARRETEEHTEEAAS